MTSTQKTPWAEFLWANAHMKKKHGSSDANTENTIGRIPMSETLVQEEKPLAIMTSTQKTPWAEFLWANAHMKKIPDSYDANTEGPMGRIPMGETLAQEEKPLAIMTSTQKTPWAEFLWVNAHMKKNPGSTDINLGNIMGHPAKSCGTSLEKSAEFLWAKFLWNFYRTLWHI